MKGKGLWNAVLAVVLGSEAAMQEASRTYHAAQAGGSYRSIHHRSQAKKRKLRRQRNQY